MGDVEGHGTPANRDSLGALKATETRWRKKHVKVEEEAEVVSEATARQANSRRKSSQGPSMQP